ncbi:hypothetical protein BDN67DRAFT_709907 [Paxillus ammoniavirescens]|nr:hypothetical protein BDN67DRAFT_709907 [Paxillus ammoniavirescens]
MVLIHAKKRDVDHAHGVALEDDQPPPAYETIPPNLPSDLIATDPQAGSSFLDPVAGSSNSGPLHPASFSSSSFTDPVAGVSNPWPGPLHPANLGHSNPEVHKSLSSRPRPLPHAYTSPPNFGGFYPEVDKSPLARPRPPSHAYTSPPNFGGSYPEVDGFTSSRPRPPSHVSTSPLNDRATSNLPGPRPRKSGSWFSLLPFTSSSSAKQVRQSIITIVHDLMLPPSDSSAGAPPNPDKVLASAAESCAKHKLSLSTILQGLSIAEHSPMYWAVVDYREELLVALLKYSRPLLAHTISDIRRACLISSNQALFHALRVRRPPFHGTDGLQLRSLHATSDTLLLGARPADEIHVEQSSDGAFIATFDIIFWQRRMRAVGKVTIEFIASGRIWSITFFSTDPSTSSPSSTRGKLRKGGSAWHVLICLLEDSPPTFLDSQLVIEIPPPMVPQPPYPHTIREARSATFTSYRDKQPENRFSTYSHSYDRKANFGPSNGNDFLAPLQEDDEFNPYLPSSSNPPSIPPPLPIHPLRGPISTSLPQSNSAEAPALALRLKSGSQKLGRRIKPGSEPPDPSESPKMKPETWWENGVNYTNSVVSPLGEGVGSHLLYENSRYLFPDGTMRARLEARLVKSETTKDCIIC